MTKKMIRVGVVGAGRGKTFAYGANELVGMRLVAVCDANEKLMNALTASLTERGKSPEKTYTDFETFLSHDMDAVVLANYCHEHAPLAVKAFEAGLHVMSECIPCSTMAEGVDLARAAEKSGKIYMLAENYPFMVYNQEMRRLFKEGFIGDFMYGEGEYVHPCSAEVKLGRSRGKDHWRNWLPATYYCTHSIAPVMYITETRPVSVNGFVVPHDPNDPTHADAMRRQDVAGILMLTMDNGAVVKSVHGALRGHRNYVRIHGNRGLMENCRSGSPNMLRTVRESFDRDPGEPGEKMYSPVFPEYNAEARKTGHGGGDFFTNHAFAEAIRKNEQPFFDIQKSLDMAFCGILGYKSALNGSRPYDIPDFSDDEVRKRFENDNWSADPKYAGEGQPAPSVRGFIEPTEKGLELSEKIWGASNGVVA